MGYLILGIKSTRAARVGDTLFDPKSPVEALPGAATQHSRGATHAHAPLPPSLFTPPANSALLLCLSLRRLAVQLLNPADCKAVRVININDTM